MAWLVAIVAIVATIHAMEKIPLRLYHGVAYHPELRPETDVERNIAEVKELGVNAARLGEFAWATMAPRKGKMRLTGRKAVVSGASRGMPPDLLTVRREP
jgi:hypothetical protein